MKYVRWFFWSFEGQVCMACLVWTFWALVFFGGLRL